MLMERWRQTKNREGQVVMISGEPGIGKSRITETFRAAIAEESCPRLRFQCSPYHTNAAFYPIIKQFEFAAGFLRDDSDEVKLDKLEALLVPANGAVSAVAQLFAKLLSIQSGDRYPPLEGTPQKLKQITLRALVDHVCTLAGNSPVVMIFEDAHWIDPTSQEALDLIAPRIAKHPVLLVITHRPDYEADWSDLMHLTQLALNRLGRAQAATMVQKVTGGKALPDEVFEQIVARTDGVPLFVEELTKTVLESGLLEEIDGTYTLTGPLPDRAIPLTLRDSLMARLDQLAKAKQVAQIGACIGREFSHELIAVVSSLRKEELNDFLAQLTDSNLLMQTGAPPEAKYTFRHALVQDAAYESLLKSKRQVLHAEIAHSMESQVESAVDSELSSIAEHFAKGAVWPKAMEYYCRAAEQAGQGFAVKEALALYDEALKSGALLDADETAARFMSIHQAKSDLYFMIGNFESARAEYAPLLEIARRLGDKDRESTALAGRAWAAFWAEDFDSALASASEAIGVAEAVDCRTALGNAHMTTGMIHAVSGQLDQAVGELDKTLSICRSASDFLRESLTLYMSGNIENWRGKFEKAIDLASTGARVAQEHNLVTAFLRCRYAQAISLTGKGEYDEALGILNDGLALAEKIGDEAFVPRYYNGLGWLYLECEDLERGLELNKQGADLSRQRRHAQGVEMTCFAEVNMGDALLASGDLRSAQDLFEGVYRVAKNPATQEWMKWRYSTHLLASLGRFWLDRGDPSKAEEFAELCLKIAVPKGSRKYIIGAWLVLGEASIARRKWEEAERWLGKARDLARSIGHQPQLWRSHFALGQLYAEIRRANASRLEYRAALSVVEQIKRNTKDPGLCKSLEASPQFRQVLEVAAED